MHSSRAPSKYALSEHAVPKPPSLGGQHYTKTVQGFQTGMEPHTVRQAMREGSLRTQLHICIMHRQEETKASLGLSYLISQPAGRQAAGNHGSQD